MDGVDKTDIAQDLAVLDSLLVELLKVFIKVGQSVHEILRGEGTERFGNNVLDVDSLLGQVQSCDTAQDDNLAGHIHSVQIVAGIGLLLLSKVHNEV